MTPAHMDTIVALLPETGLTWRHDVDSIGGGMIAARDGQDVLRVARMVWSVRVSVRTGLVCPAWTHRRVGDGVRGFMWTTRFAEVVGALPELVS